MQWLTMSAPTPRTIPSTGGQLDLGADAVGRGDEHRVVHRHDRLAEITPPKLPTPRSTSGPSVRSTACFILATARLPSSMSTPAAAYDVSIAPGARHPMSRRTCMFVERDVVHRAVRGGAAEARSAPTPVTASTRPPAVRPSTSPRGTRPGSIVESGPSALTKPVRISGPGDRCPG